MPPLPHPRISPMVMSAVGSMLVFGSLVTYQIVLETFSAIGTYDIGFLEETAYATLGLFFAGLTLIFVGITRHIMRIQAKDSTDSTRLSMTSLSSMISGRRSLKVFALVAVSYGLFFGVVSSTFVFQPGLAFSSAYGVSVPSVVPVVCCGPFGQMPQFVIYLTQQFAILIVPINLVLLFLVSWLVGLNAAIIAYAYTNRPELTGIKWISGLGAIVGLFTVCPTCAGFFFLSMISLTGAAAITLTLASLQTVFIATGIPALAITPFLASRRFSRIRSCTVKHAHSSPP
jgi:hypothetical protein